MITRRSLFGFALVPLAAQPGDLARAEAFGEAAATRTTAQMAPTLKGWVAVQRLGPGSGDLVWCDGMESAFDMLDQRFTISAPAAIEHGQARATHRRRDYRLVAALLTPDR